MPRIAFILASLQLHTSKPSNVSRIWNFITDPFSFFFFFNAFFVLRFNLVFSFIKRLKDITGGIIFDSSRSIKDDRVKENLIETIFLKNSLFIFAIKSEHDYVNLYIYDIYGYIYIYSSWEENHMENVLWKKRVKRTWGKNVVNRSTFKRARPRRFL